MEVTMYPIGTKVTWTYEPSAQFVASDEDEEVIIIRARILSEGPFAVVVARSGENGVEYKLAQWTDKSSSSPFEAICNFWVPERYLMRV